jgi:cellulose synthase/poly-beta-1,6-N-acetylglucosamine synthase-like glycosyltransferase
MTTVVIVLLVFGVNLTLWTVVGCLRAVSEQFERRGRRLALRAAALADDIPEQPTMQRADVAVLIPAHNEALVIEDTIRAVAAFVPMSNIFVVSDGSGDETAELARATGANVLEKLEAGGKARALSDGIWHFGLVHEFESVLLLDADTRLDEGYFDAALPLFEDPDVACVAGYATTTWHPREHGFMGQLLTAHRERVYAITQLFTKFGQTWKPLDVTPIVPGFAALYRTSVLAKLSIDAPGLVIEDFNMTFELRHRHLGRVAFTPAAIAYTQDPDRLSDYVKQMKRWSLGWWQTVRRHRLWGSMFCAALGLTIVELVVSSVVIATTAIAAGIVGVANLLGALGATVHPLDALAGDIHGQLPYSALLTFAAIDYSLTCVVALIQRRPRYLLLGLFFLPMRVVDSVISLVSLPKAFGAHSTGRWTSPARRTVTAVSPVRA